MKYLVWVGELVDETVFDAVGVLLPVGFVVRDEVDVGDDVDEGDLVGVAVLLRVKDDRSLSKTFLCSMCLYSIISTPTPSLMTTKVVFRPGVGPKSAVRPGVGR